jgi:hypothetical protein
MFCAPGLVFGGTGGVKSRFHVLRPRNHFRRCRGRRVPFSCFPLPDSFSVVPRSSGPVFIFCGLGLILSRKEGVGSRFHVLRSRTHLRRYRGRQVHFSCFAVPNLFSSIKRASGPVFMFCAVGLVFGAAECVGTRFHVLRAQTHFRRHRGHRVPFSYFALPDSFSAVPRVSGPVFMFCAPRLIFGDAEGVGSRFHFLRSLTLFHVLRSRTHFRRYRGRQVPISCFAHPDSFSTVPRASDPVFVFCAP